MPEEAVAGGDGLCPTAAIVDGKGQRFDARTVVGVEVVIGIDARCGIGSLMPDV